MVLALQLEQEPAMRAPESFRLKCRVDACPHVYESAVPFAQGATYACKDHSRNFVNLGPRPSSRPPFGFIRPGPFEYRYRGKSKAVPEEFEYLLGAHDHPNGFDFDAVFVDANRKHMRRLNLILENRKNEKIDRDMQFHQFEENSRTAWAFSKSKSWNVPSFVKEKDSKRYKDTTPDAYKSFTGERDYVRSYQIIVGDRAGEIFEFKNINLEWLYDLHRRSKLIVPFRPCPFEGLPVLRGTKWSNAEFGQSNITKEAQAIIRKFKQDPIIKKWFTDHPGVLQFEKTFDEASFSYVRDTDGSQDIYLAFERFWKYLYGEASRGMMRYRDDSPETLTRIEHPSGKKPAVFVNLKHPATIQAMRMFDDLFGAGSDQRSGKSEKEQNNMRQDDSRTRQRMQNDNGAADFSRWTVDDLLRVWRERKPVAVITSGREFRVLHLHIVGWAYTGLVSSMGGNPRAAAIEDEAWKAIDAEFERRVNRVYERAKGDAAKKAALTKTHRENVNAAIYTIDFGSRRNSAAEAPDILWHLASAILERLKGETPANYPEIKEISDFYPDLLAA